MLVQTVYDHQEKNEFQYNIFFKSDQQFPRLVCQDKKSLQSFLSLSLSIFTNSTDRNSQMENTDLLLKRVIGMACSCSPSYGGSGRCMCRNGLWPEAAAEADSPAAIACCNCSNFGPRRYLQTRSVFLMALMAHNNLI